MNRNIYNILTFGNLPIFNLSSNKKCSPIQNFDNCGESGTQCRINDENIYRLIPPEDLSCINDFATTFENDYGPDSSPQRRVYETATNFGEHHIGLPMGPLVCSIQITGDPTRGFVNVQANQKRNHKGLFQWLKILEKQTPRILHARLDIMTLTWSVQRRLPNTEGEAVLRIFMMYHILINL